MITTHTNPLAGRFADAVRMTPEAFERTQRIAHTLRASDCRQCALWKERKGAVAPVPGEGRGRIMLIGHRIGKQEANSGRPSIGDVSRPAFSLFLEAVAPDLNLPEMAARDVALDYVYTSNHTRCGSDYNKVPPLSARKTCSKFWLSQEIRAVDPIILVFWHAESARHIISGPVPGANVVFEGTVFGKKYPCFVMTHPASIFQDPTYLDNAIRPQYRALAKWLYDEGHLSTPPPAAQSRFPEAEHLLVTTREELAACVNDLSEKPWLALDTETTYSGAYGQMTPHELKNGALLWSREGFDLVTVQLCGLETDGTVRRTYTIAVGFKTMTGKPQQELTKEDTQCALDYLFRTMPRGGHRTVVVWNAQFDAPVMTRLGLDLLGMTTWHYPVTIVDGQLILARIDENLRGIAGLSLGKAALMYMGETKEKFTHNFTIREFPFLNIHDPDIRERVLDYTGEDPRKTMYTTLGILQDLEKHVQKVAAHTTNTPTSLPPSGFGPYAQAGAPCSGSRLRDVAVPIDHQMIPVLSQMSMTGFRFDTKEYERLETIKIRELMLLEKRLSKLGYGWLNPDSDADVSKLAAQLIVRLTAGMNELVKACEDFVQQHPGQASFQELLKALAQPLGVEIPPSDAAGYRFDARSVKTAYEVQFGELTSEQKVVTKLVEEYLEDVSLQLEGFVRDSLPAPVQQEFDRRAQDKDAPFLDFESLKEVLDTVFTYKKIGKIWGTYFVRFKKLADKHGIMNPEYKLTDTVSGRLSGNFQNVPRGGEELKGIMAQLDVRQYLFVPQADDLNRLFGTMNLRNQAGGPWRVCGGSDGQPPDLYVGVFADYAAMEDRMAYAQTGDKTKAKLLSDPDLDTHFYNAAFLFGGIFAQTLGVTLFDSAGKVNEDAVMEVYKHLKEDPDKKGYKDAYRTPVKTVHYAKQYGAGVAKIHALLYSIFKKQGQSWTMAETQELVDRYAVLYEAVETAREDLLQGLEDHPFIEYPVFGTIRHARVGMDGKIIKGEHLSVANAMNQGTCAYLAKCAMMRMRRLIYENAHRWNLVEVGGDTYVGLVIQVHDEIGVVCPARIAHEVKEVLESAMKIIVGPPALVGGDGRLQNLSFWDSEIADTAGEKGWLYLPDPVFRAATLFDAETEVKRTIAKLGKKLDKETGEVIYELLPDGQPNLYDEDQLRRDWPGARINEHFPLIVGRRRTPGTDNHPANPSSVF